MVISRAFLNKSFNYNNLWCIERLFFLQIHRAYQTWHEEKQTKSTKKVVYKDRTQWLIHFQYYTTVHIILFLVKKKLFFFQSFFLCVIVISRNFLFNCLCMDKILEKLYFLKKDICNLYIILSSYTTAADPLK